ncbi:ATP-NAD kinase-like domain-containing protein [Podospora australis]|uniref:ATP-NAD kinase-like domain-containing protein n=1 Tax=Podospora australis TaxID=1536484 RepID=A0AAN6X0A3_9PEZI|nr:ATP-NAD kinase-like domain-containing protein [Podospora australis]
MTTSDCEDKGEKQENNNTPTTLKNLKPEEIVLVTCNSCTRDYHIWSLIENPNDKTQPFRLDETVMQHEPSNDLVSTFLVESGRTENHSCSVLRANEEVHVVISTGSGLQLGLSFWKSVLKPLLEALGLHEDNGDYRRMVTQDQNSVSNFARAELATESATPATVVLISGDGGVADLLNGLGYGQEEQEENEDERQSRRQVTVGLVPLGTANALFHSLHKYHQQAEGKEEETPSTLVLALRTLFKGQPKGLPTFRAEFSPGATLSGPPTSGEDKDREQEKPKPVHHLFGAIVASYGFHASLVWESDTPSYREYGDKRFGMAAEELLKLSHAYDAVVQVKLRGQDEWKQLQEAGQPFTYVLATIVSNLEKAFTISPESKPLDGRLRLVHFGDVDGEKTMDIMKAAYQNGVHVGMEEVGYEDIEEVKVTIAEKDARWRRVCVDGTIVEIEEGGWMKVKRELKGERIQVLVT